MPNVLYLRCIMAFASKEHQYTKMWMCSEIRGRHRDIHYTLDLHSAPVHSLLLVIDHLVLPHSSRDERDLCELFGDLAINSFDDVDGVIRYMYTPLRLTLHRSSEAQDDGEGAQWCIASVCMQASSRRCSSLHWTQRRVSQRQAHLHEAVLPVDADAVELTVEDLKQSLHDGTEIKAIEFDVQYCELLLSLGVIQSGRVYRPRYILNALPQY